MEDTQQQQSQQRSGVFVEIRSASSTDAYHLGGLAGTKWIRAARIWVRTYDDSGVKTAEKLFGFVDMRNTGPRSRAGHVISRAEAYAHQLRMLTSK